jgi:hypothetical protein
LDELCVNARGKLRAEVQHAPSIRDTLRTVIYELRSSYRDIYTKAHDLIHYQEFVVVDQLEALVAATPLPETAPQQNTKHLHELLQNAFLVKRDTYDPFFKHMEEENRKRLNFFGSKMKGIWRCIEKMQLR